MLRIRAQRIGRKNSPFFRIVVIDKKTSLTGSVIDVLGYYDPHKKFFYIEFSRFFKWIKCGAKPSHLIACLSSKALCNLCKLKIISKSY